ncbi:MAG: TM2 domain-containing protein [Candidatus Omnitrophica bacterium]|nr:TM2 domain-containing protein [Candidatus Omnitrophota bacterium]
MSDSTFFCQAHPERVAIGSCFQCQKTVCLECEVSFNGKRYCRNCAEPFLFQEKIQKKRNPFFAAILAFFIPGLGQIYNGQVGKGLCIFLTWWLILPWMYGIVDAYQTARRIEQGKVVVNLSDFVLTGLVVFLMILFGPFLIWKTSQYMWSYFSRRVENVSVQERLTTISKAIEAYAATYKKYPVNETEFYFSDQNYSKAWFCDVVIDDYQYSCQFTSSRYRITAVPLESSSMKILYTVTNGSVISELPSEEDNKQNQSDSRGYYDSQP